MRPNIAMSLINRGIFLRAKIGHPIAKFIATFDHYAHTKALEGAMMEGLKDAQNIILF